MPMIWQHIPTTLLRPVVVAMLITPLLGFTFLESVLAPKADLWPRWQAFNPVSREAIDHRLWDRFLKTYVKKDSNGVNRVAYGRPVQKAFWINLYNALTVRLIIDSYPVTSIQDLDSPWYKKVIEVEGVALTLNDIEHRILRPIWRDARVHYAVNCASIGCPNLIPVAFTGGNISQLLELAAYSYINHPRGVRIKDGDLIVSKIYAWFSEDFGGTQESVIAHLREYAKPGLLDALRGRNAIDDYEYDWGLNRAGS